MEKYNCTLSAIPRQLSFPAPVNACGYSQGVDGAFSGQWKNLLEFVARMRCEDKYAVEEIDGMKYRTAIPHVLVKKPDMSFSFRIGAPREAFYVNYPADCVPFFQSIGISTEPHFLPMPSRETVIQTAKEIEALLPHRFQRGVADRIDQIAFQYVVNLFLTPEPKKPLSVYEDKIRRIEAYFRKNFREQIDLNALLKQEGLSQRTFFRYWAEIYNTSPKAYINEYRFQEAFHLLTTTNTPLSVISDSLRFPSLSYFCEQFRKRYLRTPLQLRKQYHDGK